MPGPLFQTVQTVFSGFGSELRPLITVSPSLHLKLSLSESFLVWHDGSGAEPYHNYALGEPLEGAIDDSGRAVSGECVQMAASYDFAWVTMECEDIPTTSSSFGILCSGPPKQFFDSSGEAKLILPSLRLGGQYYQNEVVGSDYLTTVRLGAAPPEPVIDRTTARPRITWVTVPSGEIIQVRPNDPRLRDQGPFQPYPGFEAQKNGSIKTDGSSDIPIWAIAIIVIIGVGVLVALAIVVVFAAKG